MTASSPAGLACRITVGGDGWFFHAAHTGQHDGVFEPLHGHTYQVQLQIWGAPDAAGLIVDFIAVQNELRAAIEPLHLRTLLAQAAPDTTIETTGGQVHLTGGGAQLALPASWVAVLPVASTSTESLAAHLAGDLADRLGKRCSPGTRLELTLAEAPDCAATAQAVLP